MDELWEEIKKLSREEQLELADQIYALADDGVTLPESEKRLLADRAQEAKQLGFPGRSADDVLAELENDILKTASAVR